MADYPAGHSMDSTWFAVDEAGEVGFFDTSEGGALPAEGFPVGGEAGANGGLESWQAAYAVLEELARGDAELAALLPATEEELGDWLHAEQGDEPRLLLSLGFHVYFCAEQDALPYFRVHVPPEPRQLSALPEHIRAHFKPGRLPLRFAAADSIAPGQFVPVETWSGYWFDTNGQAHPTSPKSQHAAKEAEEQVQTDFPQGFPIPSGSYWESIKPLTREELLAFLRQGRLSHEADVASAAAKKAVVAARARTGQVRGFLPWLQKLFGRRR